MIDLDELVEPKAPAPREELDIGALIAPVGFAPHHWQSGAPDDAWGWKPPVGDSPDLQRVAALPRRPVPTADSTRGAALVEMITSRFARPPGPCRCAEYRRDCIKKLRITQAWALYEIGLGGGLLGPIGVGHGKTILDLLAPLAMRDCRLALLLVPPTLVGQLVTEYELVGQHFRMPSLVVHGRNYSHVNPGMPVLHVLPYSRLSRPESTVFLENLRPDTIIADEVHKLRHADTATTSRVLRYFANHPGTRFCGWSGSITDSSLRDYCLDPSTRVLTSDLRWVQVGSVRDGDELIGFDEAITGARLRRSRVEGVKRLQRPRVRIVTNRGTLVCSTDHQWILRGRARTYEDKGYTQIGQLHRRGQWIAASDVRPGDTLAFWIAPWEYDESREGGYLAGLLDGEGYVSKGHSRAQVGFGQLPGPVLDAYCAGLKARGFTHSYHRHTSGVVRVIPNGDCASIRLLGMLRPVRLMKKADLTWENSEPSGRNTRHARVLAVESLDDGEVVAVQTSTRTLIAEGFLSHNCHISALALRHGSPLPLDPDVVDDWCRALDPVEVPAPAGKLLDLCAPGEHVVEGFHRRLVETPGVVSTTEPAIDADLEINERVAPSIPEQLRMMMREVRATKTRPDGDPLLDPMAVARCLRELACGFYYRWIFPPVNGVPQRREDIDAWFAARKAWRSELREKLYQRREHLDSPLLCARAAMRAWGDEPYNGDLPVWKAENWPRWRDLRYTVEYESEAVRVDDYLVRDAAEWGHSNRGVIWYDKRAFGHWVAEVSGLPLHEGGPGAGERIARERGDHSIIASIQSHGTGRDGLQRLFCTQLVANPQSSATAWEQLLGRLHRIGQAARTVYAEFYRHTDELKSLVDQALARALYVQGTLGLQQKIRTGWRLPDLSEVEKLDAVDGLAEDVGDGDDQEVT